MATYHENLSFLKACITSVLNQTFKDFEFLIVIEPHEKNIDFLQETASIDHRVRIIKNDRRLGVAGSRNRAITECSGDYIAIVDGDDYCHPERFERQLHFLEKDRVINVVGSNMYLVDEDDRVIGERRYPEFHLEIKRGFLFTMAVGNPTVMLRREDLRETGLFDSGFVKAEDFELWLRFLANGKIMHNLQENLVYYRIQGKHNEKRGKIHWRNNYLARKRYGGALWRWNERIFTLSIFFIVSHVPDTFVEKLLSLRAVDKMKRIKRSY